MVQNMSNPLLSVLGKPQQTAPNTPRNPAQMLAAFADFKRSFSGDPKAAVQQLLASGKMSREQFQQLSALANQFGSLFK